MAWFKKHDVLTKVISVLVAGVLWFYVVSVNNFDENYKLKDLVPSFRGEQEIMASKNLMIVGDYFVEAEISGSRRDLVALDRSDIRVEVDVTGITSAGTYELPYTITLPSASYTLKNKTPEKLTVKFDEEDFRLVPVKLSVEGVPANGYVINQSSMTTIPKELKLTGLQEDIDKVAYAEVVSLPKEAKETISGKLPYAFYDSEGKELKDVKISADYETIDVSIPVLKKKVVPLSLDIQGSDEFKKYINYTFSPESITIAGEESVVEQMSSFVAGSIKITEITSGTDKSFTLTSPDGIVNLSGELSATASIEFNGLSKKRIKTTLIEVINTYTLPKGYKIKPVTTSVDVDILGTDETLKNVTASNVRVVADLQSIVLSKGTHPVKVSVVVDGVKEVAVANAEEYTIYVEVS